MRGMAIVRRIEPWVRGYKDLWLRALLCWAIGIAFLFFDETSQYDLRLQIRGNQSSDTRIVLVYIDQDDWSRWHGQDDNLIRSLKEFAMVNDSYFWNESTWRNILQRILQQDPSVIGVNFFFSPQLPHPDRDASTVALFDPRVVWAAITDNEGRTLQPALASNYGSNTGLIDLREDDDRVQRHFTMNLKATPHMALRLVESVLGQSFEDLASIAGQSRLINYRAPHDHFANVSFIDVLNNRVPKNFFKNKIVIIGSRTSESHIFQTPVGSMTRSEIFANIADNILNKRWINRLPIPGSALYLLLIVILTAAVMNAYPQSVAFAVLAWLALGSVALSLYVFDSLYFWVPVLSPLILMVITYVVFLGYQLALKENQTWRLQQETHLLSELDQLKNNFVSLISHDLKTPIAKMQAICDRLLAEQPQEKMREGIQNIRKESTELHRYIQTILQISRLESSQVQLRRDPVDINDLVDKVLRQLAPLARDKHQSLDTKLEPMFSIEADGVLIQEVILNLIENAIKYTPEGGRIMAMTKEVDDKVIFSVQDSGPGLSPEDQVRIFEKFYRGQAQLSQTKGTGLGLFLVKYFVELHGGNVFIESQIGQGSTIGFALPISPEGGLI